MREAQPVIKQMAEEESPTTTLKTYLQKEFVDLVGDAYKRLAGANSKDVTDLMKPLLEKAEAIQQNTLRVLNTEAIKKEFAESSSTFKDEMKQLQTKLDNDITNVTSSMQEMKDKTVGMINELHLSDTVTAIQGVGDAYGKTVQQLQLAAQTIAGYKEPRLPEATVKAIDSKLIITVTAPR